MPRLPTNTLPQLLLLTALVALITLPNLGATGLSSSEGHRVIPALEMLDKLDTNTQSPTNLLVPHMFEQAYIRKPQLVPWIFAASLAIHDNPDLSPRIASASAFLLLTLGAYFFARSWFGRAAALPAGLAAALTPLFWSPARSAEIESIHNLFTALAAWITLHLLISSAPIIKKLRWSLLLFAATLLMLLTKGPAGFPVFAGLLLASAILSKSPRPLLTPTILIPISIATLAFTFFWSHTISAAGPSAVVQSPSAFMFEPNRIPKLLGFIPVSLLTALPITLALLFPWGPDAKSEPNTPKATHQFQTARILALSVLLALLVMMLAGVSNDRYAQPLLAAIPPLVGWLLAANLQLHRTKILNTLTLSAPKILAVVLLAGALLNITILEPRTRATSGKAPAQKLTTDLQNTLPPLNPDQHYTLIADAMIEARPETLLYLQRALANTTHQINTLWIPKLDPVQISTLKKDLDPTTPLLALIRTDQNGNESDKLLIQSIISTGKVHDFDFALVILTQN